MKLLLVVFLPLSLSLHLLPHHQKVFIHHLLNACHNLLFAMGLTVVESGVEIYGGAQFASKVSSHFAQNETMTQAASTRNDCYRVPVSTGKDGSKT